MFQAILCDDNEIILEGLSSQIKWKDLGIELTATAADGNEREFDTSKLKRILQSLETGLFFCQIFVFII